MMPGTPIGLRNGAWIVDATSATLTDMLDARAVMLGEAPAFTDLPDGEEPGRCISFAGLARAARNCAGRLAGVAPPGARVLIIMPTGIEFVVALFGCLFSGLVPVPVARPGGSPRALAASVTVMAGIAGDCRPAAILSTAADAPGLAERLDAETAQAPMLSIPIDERQTSAWPAARVTPETLGLLQYTSGSTSAPKGVQLSHRNLLANLRVIAGVIGRNAPRPIAVNWLPLYHDLGLIGGVLGSLFAGGHCFLMPTESFLRRPPRWLRAISRFQADISLAPNFAYDLAARAMRPGAPERLDLSCWKVAINCAEPVRQATLDRFSATFAPAGFDPAAFMPCYGLAEASLMVTATRRGAGATRNTLAAGLVGAGTVPAGVKLAIADPATGIRLDEGEEGEVWVSGDSVAAGYWGAPRSESFNGALLPDGGSRPWLRTGDLGKLLDGQLFITGRLKDVIKIAGRQIHPQDVEACIQMSHPRCKLGAGIAFALERPDGEVLALAQETIVSEPAHYAEAISLLRSRVFDAFGVSLDTVLLLPPGAIPKTLNGKLRRRDCRRAAERGELPMLASSSLSGWSA